MTLGKARLCCLLAQKEEQAAEGVVSCRQPAHKPCTGQQPGFHPAAPNTPCQLDLWQGCNAGAGLWVMEQTGREWPQGLHTPSQGDPEICVKPEVRVWTPPCVNYGAELVGRTRTALPCCFLASCVLSTNSPAVPLGTVLIFYIACEATNEKKKKRIEHTESNCKILTWEVETDMKYSGGSCCALCFPAVPHKDPRHFLL